MDTETMYARLKTAMPLRCPLFNPNVGGREKVEKLEDYLAQTAYHRAELEEALYWAWEAEKVLRVKWDEIEGWQNLLPSRDRAKPTERQKTWAKGQVDPATFGALDRLKTLIAGLERQIKRLELDDKNTSRRYSLLTGSS